MREKKALLFHYIHQLAFMSPWSVECFFIRVELVLPWILTVRNKIDNKCNGIQEFSTENIEVKESDIHVIRQSFIMQDFQRLRVQILVHGIHIPKFIYLSLFCGIKYEALHKGRVHRWRFVPEVRQLFSQRLLVQNTLG